MIRQSIVLLLSWSFAAFCVPADAATFLSDARLAEMDSAAEVYTAEIGAMLRSPVFVPRGKLHPTLHKRMREEDRRQLMSLLSRSTLLAAAPSTQTCKYQPGYRVDFVDAKKAVLTTLLVCFNCDVWAVAADWRSGAATNAAVFGTSKAERPQLLRLLAHYFDNTPRQ